MEEPHSHCLLCYATVAAPRLRFPKDFQKNDPGGPAAPAKGCIARTAYRSQIYIAPSAAFSLPPRQNSGVTTARRTLPPVPLIHSLLNSCNRTYLQIEIRENQPFNCRVLPLSNA